jgi:putative ABC transport system permease protein
VGRLFLYHLRLASRSLRRDPGLSAGVLVGMMISTCMWTLTAAHYVRAHAPSTHYSGALYQVELPHPGAAQVDPAGAFSVPFAPRTRLTMPETEALIASSIPSRQTATFRSRLLVAAAGQPPRPALVRFVTADFFALFARRFGSGRPWTAGEEPAAVAVLGMRAATDLGGAGTVLVDGRPHRVVGVLGEDQPYRPHWDLSAFGFDQDAVYLPFPEHRALMARPEFPIFQSAVGSTYQDLLRSDTVFVSHWVELPTAEAVSAYQRFVAERFGAGATLRSFERWRVDFDAQSGAEFFTALTFLLLLAGALNMTRLLLAKGLARREETAVFRALGAPRAALFAQHLLEAALLVLPAAVLGLVMALPYIEMWNVVVHDVDIPLRLSARGALLGVGPPVLIGIVAGLYPAWRLSDARPAPARARAARALTMAGR